VLGLVWELFKRCTNQSDRRILGSYPCYPQR